MTTTIHPAAAGVLVHERRILMVKRAEQLRAFPGYWAFPGGKVDPEDRLEGEPEAMALQRAMAREVFEEIGLNLPAMLADHQIADMADIGNATTPAYLPFRFATHFFRIDLRSVPPMTLQPDEIMEVQWQTAADWLALWRAGKLLCAPPTLAVLRALARDPDATDAPELGKELPDKGRTPCYEPIGDLHLLAVRSNTIPPAQHTNCLYIADGDRGGVLVDPSPADDKTFNALAKTIKQWPLDAILVTHHHPDHNERANTLARRRNVPILCSADTAARIRARDGDDWFDDVTLRTVGDGDVICQWQGEAVRVIAVPGHDAGQLAPMPDSRAWCIVSDLVQGIGTVVVGGAEGDMAAYFNSLERIIALDPAVIVPSHGGAMGGTWKLRETLAHRQQREDQVRTLHAEGVDVEGMLEAIYAASTPEFLMPLARINIESHLDKLRAEGRV